MNISVVQAGSFRFAIYRKAAHSYYHYARYESSYPDNHHRFFDLMVTIVHYGMNGTYHVYDVYLDHEDDDFSDVEQSCKILISKPLPIRHQKHHIKRIFEFGLL